MEFLELLLYAYLIVAAIKFALTVVDVPLAASVMCRLNGRPLWVNMLSLAITTAVVVAAMWPKLLLNEGWRFFLAYRRFAVIRSVVQVHRFLAAMKSTQVQG